MVAMVEEPGYCGLYKTASPHHWVVVWEEFGPWLERGLGRSFPVPMDDRTMRGEMTAAFFDRVFIRHVCLGIASCKIRVSLCMRGEEHMHVVLEDVIMKEGANHERG